MKQQMHDEEMWMWWGSYGLSAVSVSVERCLAGKKSKSKYIEKPVMSDLFVSEEERFEIELKEALLAEEQWIAVGKRKGLPETVF